MLTLDSTLNIEKFFGSRTVRLSASHNAALLSSYHILRLELDPEENPEDRPEVDSRGQLTKGITGKPLAEIG